MTPPSLLDCVGCWQLWQDTRYCDVQFEVEGELVHAHRVVLAYSEHTPYFRALFESGTQDGTADVIRVHDISHAHFVDVLHYLYTNDVCVSLAQATEMMKIAAQYLIKPLQLACIREIERSLCLSSVWSALELLEHCLPEGEADGSKPSPHDLLQRACVRYLVQHAQEVVHLEAFCQQAQQLAQAMVELVSQNLV